MYSTSYPLESYVLGSQPSWFLCITTCLVSCISGIARPFSLSFKIRTYTFVPLYLRLLSIDDFQYNTRSDRLPTPPNQDPAHILVHAERFHRDSPHYAGSSGHGRRAQCELQLSRRAFGDHARIRFNDLPASAIERR